MMKEQVSGYLKMLDETAERRRDAEIDMVVELVIIGARQELRAFYLAKGRVL